MTPDEMTFTSRVVHRLPANTLGRDFAIGDVHGMFSFVERAMADVRFDAGQDRLFAVGDLIDRGPDSGRMVEFLEQPFVHAVRGNHEDMLLRTHPGTSRMSSPALWSPEAEWWLDLSEAERQRVVEVAQALPLAIEVETGRGPVGFIHADVPKGMDWPAFCRALEAGDPETIDTALWGRDRIQDSDHGGVAGIGRLFVGHTPQWGGLRRFGNVYAVDTGAVFTSLGGRLSLVNIRLGTAEAMAMRSARGVDVRDTGSPPGKPFGQYARGRPSDADDPIAPDGNARSASGTQEPRR